MDRYEHPNWCAPSLCSSDSTDLLHREVGELLAPANDPERAIQVERLRGDEIGHDQQTEFPAELRLSILGEGGTHITKGEAVQLASLLIAMAKAA